MENFLDLREILKFFKFLQLTAIKTWISYNLISSFISYHHEIVSKERNFYRSIVM